jgi:hypothetical protein
MTTDSSKFIIQEVWDHLIAIDKLDLIDLLAKVEKKEIHTLKIKRPLVENRFVNIMILKFMKDNGVNLIMEYEEKANGNMGHNKTT